MARGGGKLSGGEGALALSRAFFEETALPALEKEFPEAAARAAAGLAGNGSECFGYDDEVSRDHDWGVDFFLWVPEEDRALIPALAEWKARVLRLVPPELLRTRSEYGAEPGVMTVGDFYKSLIGCPGAPRKLGEWLAVPEENLAMAVNGEVFRDPAGEFTAVRRELERHYPDDILLKRMSVCCMTMAQTGQYNYLRCARRGDVPALREVTARFSFAAAHLSFLLARRYMPYYKWAFRALAELPAPGPAVAALLTELASEPALDAAAHERQTARIEAVCGLLGAELRRRGLSDSESDFFTGHGEALRRRIKLDALRELPAQFDPFRKG
jgi:hypothetical protein